MLGVRRIGRDRADYYLADLARELPVAAPARWFGGAAAGLGLGAGGVAGPRVDGRRLFERPPGGRDHRGVAPEAFRALLEGRHPTAGWQMGSGRTVVAGYDLTFSAPKSVSVLLALGGEEMGRRIVSAHADAVAAAASYVERHALGAARGSGEERSVVTTTGMAAAVFTHGVTRTLDPHLHSHVVMANLVHGVDGRWGACDGRGLWAHREAGAAVYGAALRAGLAAELGVRWTARGEVEGVAPALRGEFSSRGADIRRHMDEHGARSARGRHVAWAATRPDKLTGTPYGVLERVWAERAATVVGRDGLKAVRGIGAAGRTAASGRVPLVRAGVVDEHRYAGVIARTPHGGARRRDVVTALGAGARDGVGAASMGRLADAWAPEAETTVGVAEAMHPRGAVVPAPYLVGALGPRPLDAERHDVWLQAARTVEGYRERWHVSSRSRDVLGAGTGASLASLPAARLADHVRTTRELDVARARLGWRAPRRAELGLDVGR